MPAQKPTEAAADIIHSDAFLASLMARQLRLSITCALAFVVMLAGLPLLNHFAPDFMRSTIPGGFTLTWFLLGIAFFPAVWLISWIFIRRSMALEQSEVAQARSSAGANAGQMR